MVAHSAEPGQVCCLGHGGWRNTSSSVHTNSAATSQVPQINTAGEYMYVTYGGYDTHIFFKTLCFQSFDRKFQLEWKPHGNLEKDTHCSPSSQDYRLGVLPYAYQSLLSLKNMPDEFREY